MARGIAFQLGELFIRARDLFASMREFFVHARDQDALRVGLFLAGRGMH
jgi:hypothetical protein